MLESDRPHTDFQHVVQQKNVMCDMPSALGGMWQAAQK